MNNTIYIVIFCIVFRYVKSDQVSETFEDINYEENEKLNVQVSEANEGENDDINEKLETHDEEMEEEREAGDAADLFGTNQHYNIPVNYQDFGRRFVLTYPYFEKNILNDAAEAELDKAAKIWNQTLLIQINFMKIKKGYLSNKVDSSAVKACKQYLQLEKAHEKELTPVKAPPEFVLEIAKQSALLEASKPKNPTEDIIQKDILRTGDYWDDVWKEEVDVKKMMLRSGINQNKLGAVTVKISPGSKLQKLISMLKKRSPRFLYVINKNSQAYFVV
ncbi:jg27913 [Pararge aegeria aegeria]|uniref:Jg27913 protein n=1 Tax=Pararge aegeria aegeria TaxID=348720 RepID=A0A8S4RTA6_9NEOP|nr:jg27913 [Pararge aegeria aegeria]